MIIRTILNLVNKYPFIEFERPQKDKKKKKKVKNTHTDTHY